MRSIEGNGRAVRFGSVCSGIEAASVAWRELGWEAAWLSEIEPFPSAVLAHHYPSVPNLGDMTTIARRVLTAEVEAPDVLCGGTPCQAFSVAGLRESLSDERGNLTLKFVELADAIDHVRIRAGKPAAVVFWENVPGVLSTKDNAFGCFLGGLAGEDGPLQPPGQDPKKPIRWSNAGCVYGPQRAIAWRTLDAQYFGVAQRRRRVFVVASARNDFDPATVLFEWDGLRRDTAPGREAGKGTTHDTAPCLTSSGRGVERTGDTRGQDPVVAVAFGGNNTGGPIDVATARNACASASGRMDFESETFLVQPQPYTLAIRGRGDSHNLEYRQDGTANALLTPNGGRGGIGVGAIAFDTTQITSPANGSNPKPGDACHPLAAGAHAPAIAFPANLSGTQHASTENLAPAMGAKNPTAIAVSLRGREGGATAELGDEVQNCLRASSGGGDKPHVLAAMQVRRLTPTECERLQGFPDGYTAIPWRGKPAGQCPDGPRYKALGNSWATTVVRWLGRRISDAISASEARAA